jgi:2-polyprenyl-3-methyl-5-hydroxy-6-metoxy-1,4-benzoquinol methylase
MNLDFRYRACPVCESVNADIIHPRVREFYREDLRPRAYKCNVCSMVFLNPVMTPEEYEKFYHNDTQKKFVKAVCKETESDYYHKINKDDIRRAKIINKYFGDFGCKCLDVGTGYSNFTSLVPGSKGIDISAARVKAAKEIGLDVEQCSIFEWKEEVDVITLFHVLEHIVEPLPFLQQIYDILPSRGKLIIEVPNHNDILTSNCDYKEFYFQNAHCSYFNKKTIKKILKRGGFKINKEIKFQRYSLGNHLYWFTKGRPGKFNLPKWLDKVYNEILKLFGVHDTLFLICDKE